MQFLAYADYLSTAHKRLSSAKTRDEDQPESNFVADRRACAAPGIIAEPVLPQACATSRTKRRHFRIQHETAGVRPPVASESPAMQLTRVQPGQPRPQASVQQPSVTFKASIAKIVKCQAAAPEAKNLRELEEPTGDWTSGIPLLGETLIFSADPAKWARERYPKPLTGLADDANISTTAQALQTEHISIDQVLSSI